MIINHNIASLNTYRQLSTNNTATSKSLEKLSSGLRINRAGDDAAGLAISEKMRGQIRGLDQATRNSQDGISLIQTAEGALNETHSILQRMRELAVQSSNDTNTTADRDEIQKEINQLTSEINRIGNSTEFNTQKLLNGDKANTLAVSGVRFATTDLQTATASGIGLNIELLTSGAVSDGLHTLTVTSSRNVASATSLTPTAPGYDSFTLDADTAIFASNKITIDAGAVTATSTITLTWDETAQGFKITGTLEGAASNQFGSDEYAYLGEVYDNHGISFTLTDAGTMQNGGTIVFSALAAGNVVGTAVSGYEQMNATTQATFAAPITVTDTGSGALAHSGGGYVQLDIASNQVQVRVFDASGSVIVNDTVMSGKISYDNHGISFAMTAAVTGAGSDVIRIDLADDTYNIQAQLDSGAIQTLASSYNGTATGVVSNFTGISGLELNQADGDVLAAGTYTFTTEQNVTGQDKSATFQIGANTSQGMDVDIDDMRSLALEITSNSASDTKPVTNSMGSSVIAYYTATKNVTNGTNNTVTEYALDVSSGDKSTAAIKVIDDAITSVSAQRSKLGAFQNRLEHTINNLGTSSENLTAAESRIRDVDMAKEMMTFTKNNILSQAATAMLAQANQTPQNVLQLLR